MNANPILSLLWIGGFKKHHHYLMIQFTLTLMRGCSAFKSSIGDIRSLFSSTCFVYPHISELRCFNSLSACICTHLYVKACTGFYTVYVQEQFSNPPIPTRQDSAISVDQFPLNPDELLMPTFCFLLMGKSFEIDFFLSSQWILQLFKVSILFPDIALVERSADQDSWHGDIVALTLRWILNPACINTYSSMPYHQAGMFTQCTEL